MSDETRAEAIGLLAAWGDYPVAVASALKAAGFRVVVVGVRDHCDPRLADIADDFGWVGLAQLGAATRIFRRYGVRQATMAGKIHKVRLYQPWFWWRHRPDWLCLKTFYPHFVSGRRDRKDDTLLSAIVSAFASRGIEFVPATDFAPHLLAREGQLAGRTLTAAAVRDVQFGWQLAKELGRHDVGQSVCVKGQAVLAVEAIEGTDECIARAGELCPAGGFTVVKVAKLQQDMRFDVPTVGARTLRTMAAAGGRVLAIEAGRTIILDADGFAATAARLRIAVVAINGAAGSVAGNAAA